MPPLVSVIVAAFNEERRVGECLESLLAQTYQPLEIFVANDGSRDATSDVVRRYANVKLLDFPHRGKGPTINDAVGHAAGEVVIFADADLVYDPEYVAALAGPIVRGECEGTSHATELVANPENPWSRCLQFSLGVPPDLRLQLSDSDVAAGTAIFRAIRRARFVEVNGFEDTAFTDDSTLAPKLTFNARFVREAKCRHYNPETLEEIFGRGRWMGKSLYLKHGAKSLARLLPPFTWIRAARVAWRSRMLEMIPFTLVEDAGMALGVGENSVRDASRGKNPIRP